MGSAAASCEESDGRLKRVDTTVTVLIDNKWILLEELQQAKEAEAERALIRRWSEK
jgi:hypothetical protein